MARLSKVQVGWLLFLIATLSLPVVYLAGGGGQLAALAVLPATLGAAMQAWGKLTEHDEEPGKSLEEFEQELAAVMLEQGQTMLARLLSTGGPADTAANVTFVRSEGHFREVGGERWGDMSSVLEYYRSLHPGRLVILGDPGSGKTVLALELLTRLLEQRGQAAEGERPPVPIWLSATSWRADRNVEEWLVRQLVQRFRMSEWVATKLVQERRILPIVDGLDEMDPSGEPAVRAQTAVEQLNAYMAGREKAAMVVTCRRAEYRMLKPGLDRATHVEITPLTGTEAARYLRDQLYDQSDLKAWEPVLTQLEQCPDGLLASQLTTPWRLTLATTVYRHGGDPAELLPPEHPDEAAARQYAQRINDLLLSRYVPAAVRAHPADGRYSPERVEHWLTVIAAHLDWQARHGMSSTDIILHRWWRISGDTTVRTLHVMIAAIPALIYAIMFSIQPDIFIPLVVLLWGIALWGLRTPRPKHLSFHRLRTRQGLRQATLGSIMGFALGFFFSVMGSIVLEITREQYEFDLVSEMPNILIFAVVFAFSFGLVFGLSDPSLESFGPRDILRAERRYGLISGVSICIFSGIMGVIVMFIVNLILYSGEMSFSTILFSGIITFIVFLVFLLVSHMVSRSGRTHGCATA